MLSLLEEASRKGDTYLEIKECDKLKLLFGGITMQPIHLDNKLLESKRNEMSANDQQAMLEKSSSMLMCCNKQYPARICVLNKFAGDENGKSMWKTIKDNFLTGNNRTKAKVDQELTDNVYVFRAPAMVFDGTVPHAGMPVQNYSNAADNSPIKILETRIIEKDLPVHLQFLKSIERLDTISRIFLETWPEDEFGAKSENVSDGDVDIVLKL